MAPGWRQGLTVWLPLYAGHRCHAALAGCSEAQIAAITGHSLRDVSAILDRHYLHRDPELARAAIARLELAYARRLAETETRTSTSK
jgi:hypothetical protein